MALPYQQCKPFLYLPLLLLHRGSDGGLLCPLLPVLPGLRGIRRDHPHIGAATIDLEHLRQPITASSRQSHIHPHRLRAAHRIDPIGLNRVPHYHSLGTRDHPEDPLEPLAIAIDAVGEPPEPDHGVPAAHKLRRHGIGTPLAADPLADLRIDPLEAVFDVGLEEPAVDEHGVADDEHGGEVGEEPPRDGPVGAERGEAGSNAIPELRLDAGELLGDSQERVLGGRVAAIAAAGAAALDGKAGAVPARPGGELPEALGRGEAEVAGDVHDLVVPHDGEERAALAGGGDGEAADEVEEAYLVAAAVEDVAELDGEGGAGGPGGGVVGRDEAGEAEGGEGLGEVAVEVADGDEAGGGGGRWLA